MRPLLVSLILAWTLPFPVKGEVENVVITWNAAACLNICAPELEKNLRTVKGVVGLHLNPIAGAAEIEWSPNTLFSFYPINFAAKTIGVQIRDVRLRVRGTVAHDFNNVYLISVGDGTQFQLAGPIPPQSGYMVRNSIASHPLSPSVRQQLLDAENRRQIITIEGPLLAPYRYSLVLITEQVKIPPPKRAQFSRYLY